MFDKIHKEVDLEGRHGPLVQPSSKYAHFSCNPASDVELLYIYINELSNNKKHNWYLYNVEIKFRFNVEFWMSETTAKKLDLFFNIKPSHTHINNIYNRYILLRKIFRTFVIFHGFILFVLLYLFSTIL